LLRWNLDGKPEAERKDERNVRTTSRKEKGKGAVQIKDQGNERWKEGAREGRVKGKWGLYQGMKPCYKRSWEGKKEQRKKRTMEGRSNERKELRRRRGGNVPWQGGAC
jgi:hypothetical protein